MSTPEQKRIPDEIVAQINEWRRKIREDRAVLTSPECRAWINEMANILFNGEYEDHLKELSRLLSNQEQPT